MKLKTGILVAAMSAITLTACGLNSADSPRYVICSDSVPENQARDMALALGPEESALTLVEWMATASPDDRSFARVITRELTAIYATDSTGKSLTLFTNAVDAANDSLPLPQQARVLTVAASPSQLGAAMRESPDADALIPLIEDIYKTDSTALSQFRNSLKH